jgi:sRNA-binding carbon storage regulator CsrA
MRREIPTSKQHLPGARVVRTKERGTLLIGDSIECRIVGARDGMAILSVWAPRSLKIDTRQPEQFAQNNDGPSVGAPEPSAKQSVIDQDSGVTHGEQ